MESSGGMSGPMLPGMLGLEMPLHQQHPRHHLQQQQPQQHQMSPFASSLIHDTNADHSHQQRHPYVMPINSKPPTATTTTTTTTKQQVSSFSDDDEAASGYAAEDVSGGGGDARSGKRGSMWQRMKWTDEMVRLLIMVVFFVGDDGGGLDAGGGEAGKKKLPGGGGGGGSGSGLLQKKGKWKSVSRAMLEKGFRVSPQQCEDKFNDLNKRYKRVIDIVGKGTACRVVENPSLLETMDHISPKMKDEVRKLLNSKHLFFREMCAYHSSCAGGHQSCEAEPSTVHQQQQQQQPPLSRPHEQRNFLQDSGGALAIYKDVDGENEGDYDDDDDDDNDDEDEEDDIGCGDYNDVGEDDENKGLSRKRPRGRSGSGGDGGSVSSLSPMQQQLNSEMASVFQDGGKTVWEQRRWIKSRSVMLEEQRVSYQCRAFELEKQRFKWQKYSRKKEREFERMKLENERMKLENERMSLVLRQKEMEMDGMIKRDPSITG